MKDGKRSVLALLLIGITLVFGAVATTLRNIVDGQPLPAHVGRTIVMPGLPQWEARLAIWVMSWGEGRMNRDLVSWYPEVLDEPEDIQAEVFAGYRLTMRTVPQRQERQVQRRLIASIVREAHHRKDLLVQIEACKPLLGFGRDIEAPDCNKENAQAVTWLMQSPRARSWIYDERRQMVYAFRERYAFWNSNTGALTPMEAR